MAGFVFHGAVFPFQGRDGGSGAVSLMKGEVTLPSIGGEFSRKDGPWVLPAVGSLGSGRIQSVERTVKGEQPSTGVYRSTVECTMEGLSLPGLKLKADRVKATLVSNFGPAGRTFEESVEVVNLQIAGRTYSEDAAILGLVKGQSKGSLRSSTDTTLMAHLAVANTPQGLAPDSDDNLACYLIAGPHSTASNASVAMGEYSIGDDARRLTMLRVDDPASPDDSIVLLQLFVNGHRPP